MSGMKYALLSLVALPAALVAAAFLAPAAHAQSGLY